jgi:hypothetical protein
VDVLYQIQPDRGRWFKTPSISKRQDQDKLTSDRGLAPEAPLSESKLLTAESDL